MHALLWQVLRAVALVLTIGALDFGLLAAGVPYRPSVQSALVVSALAAQIGLASVWFVIGRDRIAARLCVLLSAAVGVWWFLLEWYRNAEEELAAGFWVQGVVVIGVLLLLRAMHFRTVRGSSFRNGDPPALLPRFSIRGVLLLTGLVCASLAIVPRMQSLSVQRDAALISCIVGMFLAVLTLASLVATLVSQNVGLYVLLVCASSVLVGWGIAHVLAYDELALPLAIATAVSVQTGVLLAARSAGFRFVRN